MKKESFSLIMLTALATSAFADHNVQLSYDAGGNRISRAIVVASAQARRSTELSDSTTAIFTDTFAAFKLNVYPNPTEGQLKIELEDLPDGETFRYVIVSTNGREIIREPSAANGAEADLTGCPAGMYILKLFYKEETKEFKIIKL